MPLFLIPGVCRKNAPFCFALVGPLHPNSEALRRDFRLSSMRALHATTSPSLCFIALSVHSRFPKILPLGGSADEPKKRSFLLTPPAPHPPPHNVEVLRSVSCAACGAKGPHSQHCAWGGGVVEQKQREERFFCTTRYQKLTWRKASMAGAGARDAVYKELRTCMLGPVPRGLDAKKCNM
jgi:hypothetical protein